MSSPLPMLPGVPEQIARYQLISELGRGSMGHVYLALDPNIDRKVALKIFLPLLKVGAAEQWELRQRFVLEARAAGQLNHPGIVTIFDADTDPDTGLSYLAMEWVNGPSLDELIRESGPVSVERSLGIVEEVAVALDAAHRQGLVHRDIKPANILLENSGRAKVTDFGIAKLASMSITTTGWIPGSPFYMSPEQIRNESIDRRSDLWALGAVLYQCLTGKLPFEAESLAALTHMILEIDPRPVRSINPRVSADLAAVIDTALAKAPDDRFDSGREFALALQKARAGVFRRESGSPAACGGRPPVAEEDATGDPLAAGSTGTIGIAAPAAVDSQVEETTAAPEVTDPMGAAPQNDAGAQAEAVAATPGLDVPPAVEETATRTGLGRVAVAMGAILALAMIVWSLRPVASEPAGPVPALARLFSPAPRFSVDAPPAAGGIEAPTEPPEAAEPAEIQAQVSTPEPRRAAPLPVARPPAPARRAPVERAAAEPATVAGEDATVATAVRPVAAAPAPPAKRATSKLEIVYRNRLKGARLSVFVDGERVYSNDVATRPSFFKRAVGKNVWTSLDLTPGEHLVDVRVTGVEGRLDLVRQTSTTFEDGQTHRLRVTVTPLKKLKLTWKDSPDA